MHSAPKDPDLKNKIVESYIYNCLLRELTGIQAAKDTLAQE
jgi:hypothetical protein